MLQSRAAAAALNAPAGCQVPIRRPATAADPGPSPGGARRRGAIAGRSAAFTTVVALHGLVGMALLRAVSQPAPVTPPTPIFASLLLPRPAVETVQSPPPPRRVPRRPVPRRPLPVAAEATASPATAPPAATAPSAPAPPAVPRSEAGTPTPPPLLPPRFDAAYLDNPAPAYPALSRRLGEQGLVRLRVLVSAAGEPERVELERSSGSLRLDHSAQAAVARWRFVPARRGSEAVPAWVIVPISFHLGA